MTTATRSVAVVATQLPTTDRRALSQAWFSALHEAQPAPAAARARAATTAHSAGSAAAAPRIVAGTRTAPRIAPAALPPQVAAPRSAAQGPAPERRAAAGVLARRIERAVARHVTSGPPVIASMAIKAGAGRVQLLVRGDGATTRIVALCAPHLRERVDRALAQARFALAAAGNRVEVVR